MTTQASHSKSQELQDNATPILGIDVGGSGIKGALVDLETGEFVSDRRKIRTPEKSTPDAVADIIQQIIEYFEYTGPVGITLPSVIIDQKVYSAANIDKSWIGTDLTELFARHLPHHHTVVLNDADAAGIAEVAYGIPEARYGAVLFLTFGTGIGSAMLINGELYPNSELGHMLVGKKEAEHRASSAVKDREELSFKEWAKRVDRVLAEYEALFNPNLFIVGGGISRESDKWVPRLHTRAKVVPAQLRNRAGIVGAALAVRHNTQP